MLDLLAYTLAGIGLGMVTGLIPGLHVNNLTPFFVSLAAGASTNIAVLVVAMSITNVFISYIPSTFLGVPEEGTELSVLPAHRLLLEGRGYHAIRLTAIGCLGGLLLSTAILLPFLVVITPAYDLICPQMHWLLISVVVVMIALERSWKGRTYAAGIFLLSGMLGLLTLDTNIMLGDAALMPLLSGLFGVSVLLPSITGCSSLPEQNIDDDSIDLRSSARPLCAGTAAGAITGVIPSIGPSQGTVMAQLATRSSGAEEFLVSVSSVNTSKALFSFVALYAIGRARSGAAIAVGEIMDFGGTALVLLVGVALLSGGIAAVLHLKIGKLAARYMDRFPYRALGIAVLIFMIAMTIYYAGISWLLVLATATAIGLLPATVRVKRTHAMGVIMVPCIAYFAGIKGGLLAALGL